MTFCESESEIPDRFGGLTVYIVHGTVDGIIMLFILFCNILIIFAILRYHRKLKLAGMLPCPNHASVRLVLSLATADIMSACFTIYFLLFEYSCTVHNTWGREKLPCMVRFVPFMIVAAASCYSLLGLAIDRYIAVVHSMRYRDIMTSRVTHMLIVCIWILAIITGGPLLFWNNWTPGATCEEHRIIPIHYVTIVCITFASIAISALFVLHWLVHREAKAAITRKNTMKRVYNPNNLGPPSPNMKGYLSKSARVMFLVVGTIIVLWTPVTVVVILRGQGMISPTTDFIYGITFTFYNLTYFANSFIYSWKNSTIKLAILQVFGSTRKKPSPLGFRTNSIMQNSTMSEFNSTSSALNVA